MAGISSPEVKLVETPRDSVKEVCSGYVYVATNAGLLSGSISVDLILLCHRVRVCICYCIRMLWIIINIFTKVFEIEQIVDHLRKVFRSRRTFPLEYRLEQLRNLKRMINENLPKLFEAVWIDLHKVHCFATFIHFS